MEKSVGAFSIIEHFGVFFRFKLDVHIAVAAIFGLFEENVKFIYFFYNFINFVLKKRALGIEHYSIK